MASPGFPGGIIPPTGTLGNDKLNATQYGGIIDGKEGDDSITGKGGGDLLYGNIGNDTLLGAGGDDQLQGGEGSDSIDGGIGNDLIIDDSTGGAPTPGQTYNDTIKGGAGNDSITVSRGNDIISDESGDETYIIQRYGNSSVTINDAGGADKLQLFWSGSTATFGEFQAEYNDIRLIDSDSDGSQDDLLIRNGADNDQIVINNFLSSGFIENWIFSDANKTGDDMIQLIQGLDDIQNTINGAAGTKNDVLTGTIFRDSMNGLAGNDSLSGGAGNDTLIGDLGNDTLNGGSGDNTLDGGAGNDLFIITDAAVGTTIADVSGTDTIDFSALTAGLNLNLTTGTGSGAKSVTFAGVEIENAVGGAGNDTITGSAGANKLVGNGGNDTLNGAGGNDTLEGGAGDDVLDGGADNDSMTGGDGNDTYYVDSLLDKVVEAATANSGSADKVITTLAAYTLGANIENLQTTNATGSLLVGNAVGNTLTGGTGNDTLLGLAGNDSLVGGDGNDSLDGGAGNDTMTGGAGNDTYVIDSVGDSIIEASGNDTVVWNVAGTLGPNGAAINLGTDWGGQIENVTLGAASKIATMTGTNGANYLTGNSGAQTINGNAGDDTLVAGGGKDSLVGGADNDTYFLFDKNTEYFEVAGQGTDTVFASFDITLKENFENLGLTGKAVKATGNEGDNVITGNDVGNLLQGLGGNDTLIGNGGHDTLDGGAGNSSLDGGEGNDLYLMSASSGNITITDSTGNDTLDASTLSDALAVNMHTGAITRTPGFSVQADPVVNVSAVSSNYLAPVSTTYLSDGKTVVLFKAGGSGDDDIRGRIYNANGTAFGSEFTVNNDNGSPSGQNEPTISLEPKVQALSNGRFVVTWTTFDSASLNDADVYARIYQQNGTYGAKFLVGSNTAPNQEQRNPVVAEMSNGNLMFVYGSEPDGNEKQNVYYRVFNTSGVAQGAEVRISVTPTGNSEPQPVVTQLQNGNFAVAYQTDGGIAYRVVNPVTGAMETEGTITSGGPTTPTVVALENGGFLLGWRALNGAAPDQFIFQIFNASGTAVTGSSYVVLKPGNVLSSIGATELSNGGALISWRETAFTSGGNFAGTTFRGHIFNGSTNAYSPVEFNLPNKFTTNEQIVALDTGGFVVTWQGSEVSNSDYALYGQYYNEQGVAVGDRLIIDTTNASTQPYSLDAGTNGTFTVTYLSANFDLPNKRTQVSTREYRAGTGTPTQIGDVGNGVLENFVGGGGDDVVSGTAVANKLVGNGGNDDLDGDDGNDTLDGGAGDDTLRGGAGNDSMTGGTGNDTYYVDSALDKIVEASKTVSEIDTVVLNINGLAAYTLGANLENLTNESANGIRLLGNAAANSITGGSGNDTLVGGAGNDTLTGGNGDDYYILTAADFSVTKNGVNTIYTALDQINELNGTTGGSDTIETPYALNLAFSGNLNYFANIENMIVTGAIGSDIIGTSANNLLAGGSGADAIQGKEGDDSLRGGAGNDSLYGGEGNDTMDGGAGVDRMEGGDGDDTYYVDVATDTIVEEANKGNDTVIAGIDFSLFANVENLELTGKALKGFGNGVDNRITGNDGNNSLSGGNGNDTLVGAGGNDTLDGGSGDNTLNGGAGNDVYLVGEGRNTTIVESLVNGGTDTLDFGFSNRNFVIDLAGGTGSSNTVSEFRVNTYTESMQFNPAMAVLPNGDYVITWVSDQDGSNTGIYAQRYNAGSIPIGPEFRVNTFTKFFQVNPAIAALSNGDFVIVWESPTQDSANDQGGIYGQRYNSLGVPLGKEFRVNTLTAGLQTYPGITALDDGSFVVAWQSGNANNSEVHVKAQRYDANGKALGAEFMIDRPEMPNPSDIEIAAVDGGFVATWTIYSGSSLKYEVYARRFNTAGVALGNEFRVNSTTSYSQYEPAISRLNNGGFVITWTSTNNTGATTVYMQRYDANGNTAGSETLVSNIDVYKESPAVVNLKSPGSGYVVVWAAAPTANPGGALFEIKGQRYNDNGTTAGGVFTVNIPRPQDHQYSPSVIAMNDGGFVVSWDSINYDGTSQDGSSSGVYAVRFNAQGQVVQEGSSLTFGAETIETVLGGAGNDTITGTSFANKLVGNGGNDSLDGGQGNDTLDGGAGNDTLNGGAGNDSMTGGLGDDTYYVDSLTDKIVEAANAGTDTVVMNFSKYTLLANFENLELNSASVAASLTGNAVNNRITGNGLNDTLLGLSGNDTLIGGAGDDSLDGGAGNDRMEGGEGNDTYLFKKGEGADSITTGGGTDILSFGATVTKNTIAFFKDGNTLQIAFKGAASDSIQIIDQFEANKGLAEIRLSNGQFLNASDLNAIMQTITAYDNAHNEVTFTSAADVANNAELMTQISNAWHT